MKYIWLLIGTLFGISSPISHAETQEGEIKDTEFLIEKQKKNKINQEPRLFFKAPTRTTKSSHKPLTTIQALKPEHLPFDAAAEKPFPFRLDQQPSVVPCPHYCRLGISLALLPYVDLALHKLSCLQGIWSTNIACIPAYWHKNTTEGIFGLKGRGKYGIASWCLDPALHYQHTWYSYDNKGKTKTYRRNLHQGGVSLFAQRANASAIQEGQIDYNLLTYHDEKIREQFFRLQYKWKKRLDNLSLQIKSYNDIAYYANDTNQKTRTIFSVTPGLIFQLPKELQVKTRLKIAYHNGPISGIIPSFDFYPMLQISHAGLTWLKPYIGIDGMGVGGSVQPLHLEDLVTKNPFIAKNSELAHYHQYLQIYGGSKGTITANLLYHFRITYRHRKNLSRMVPTSEDYTIYKPCYNREGHKLIKAMGRVAYHMPSIHLNTTLQGSYYNYFKNKNAPVWWYNKPKFKLKSSLAYRPHPKVSLTGTLNLYDAPILKDAQGKALPQADKVIMHIALGGTYCFFKKLSASLMVGNHLYNHRFIHYAGYRKNQFNITGDLAYRW